MGHLQVQPGDLKSGFLMISKHRFFRGYVGDGNLCTCSSVNSQIGAGPSGGRVGPLLVSSTVARLAHVLGFVVLFVPLRVRLLLRGPGGGKGGPDIFESENDVLICHL